MLPRIKALATVLGVLLLLDVLALLVWPGFVESYEVKIQRVIPLLGIGLVLLGSMATTAIVWLWAKRSNRED